MPLTIRLLSERRPSALGRQEQLDVDPLCRDHIGVEDQDHLDLEYQVDQDHMHVYICVEDQDHLDLEHQVDQDHMHVYICVEDQDQLDPEYQVDQDHMHTYRWKIKIEILQILMFLVCDLDVEDACALTASEALSLPLLRCRVWIGVSVVFVS